MKLLLNKYSLQTNHCLSNYKNIIVVINMDNLIFAIFHEGYFSLFSPLPPPSQFVVICAICTSWLSLGKYEMLFWSGRRLLTSYSESMISEQSSKVASEWAFFSSSETYFLIQLRWYFISRKSRIMRMNWETLSIIRRCLHKLLSIKRFEIHVLGWHFENPQNAIILCNMIGKWLSVQVAGRIRCDYYYYCW